MSQSASHTWLAISVNSTVEWISSIMPAQLLSGAALIGLRVVVMGSITFTGERPFELALQQMPKASALGERPLLTLPILVSGFPQDTVEVRLPLSIQQAEQLAAQLEAAIAIARAHSR
jgi:hypothetical protein